MTSHLCLSVENCS